MFARPASPLRGSACLRTSFMPLYCLGLWDAVICAPPSKIVAGHRVVQDVGAQHAKVDDVCTLGEGAVDEGVGESG